MIALLLAATVATATPTPGGVGGTERPPYGSPTGGGTPTEGGKTSNKPIDIAADKFDLNGKEKKGVFRGHVIARQGDVTIRANQVEAAYSQTSNAIVKAVAEGGVEVTSGAKTGRADRAEFDNEKHTVVLSGSPRLWESGSLVEGKEIVFHVDDGRVECFDCVMDVDPTKVRQMEDEMKKGGTVPAP